MAPRGVERKLAAILAADMVGYSRLMGADEVGAIGCSRRAGPIQAASPSSSRITMRGTGVVSSDPG